jgi:hypothetical protein
MRSENNEGGVSMKVEVTHEHGKVTLVKGNMRVTMTTQEFEKRVCGMTEWYNSKPGSEEYDKYHGNAKAMFDPNAPFPQTFNSRVSVRWKPSGAVNGPIITPATALQHYMRKVR